MQPLWEQNMGMCSLGSGVKDLTGPFDGDLSPKGTGDGLFLHFLLCHQESLCCPLSHPPFQVSGLWCKYFLV